MVCQKPKPKSDIRLQKFLALCGVASRRACERLIDDGRVAIDGRVVEGQGARVNPLLNAVSLDGRRVVPQPAITLLFHKPRNVICTSSDPAGRKTIHAFLPALPARVFTVGRLDYASEGLIVITSDGELAQAISHPRNTVDKIYLVTAGRALTPEEQKRLRKGFRSEGEFLRISDIQPAAGAQSRHVYKVIISEGKNRHIRRMFAGLSLNVLALKRIAVGPLKLGNLPVGQWRYVTRRELDELQRYIAERAGRLREVSSS